VCVPFDSSLGTDRMVEGGIHGVYECVGVGLSILVRKGAPLVKG
jgi:hypothetical protein